MKLGPAIKSIRRQLNITQQDLSQMTDISQTSLSKIESGTMPSEKNLKKICEALNVPTSVVYILAMEKSDIPASKRHKYDLIFPAIKSLVFEIVNTENEV